LEIKEIKLNIEEIISQLRTEKSHLDQAIAVLEGISSNSADKAAGRTAAGSDLGIGRQARQQFPGVIATHRL